MYVALPGEAFGSSRTTIAYQFGKGDLGGVPSKSSIPPFAVAPFDAETAKEHQEVWAKYLDVPVVQTNSIGMKLVLIPPGEFTMGSPQELTKRELNEHKLHDPFYVNRLAGETPEHRVTITKPYWLGETCVTQEEYERVMGANPSAFTEKQLDPSAFDPALPDDQVKRRLEAQTKMAGIDTKRHPVETITWDDAVESAANFPISQLGKGCSASSDIGLPTAEAGGSTPAARERRQVGFPAMTRQYSLA